MDYEDEIAIVSEENFLEEMENLDEELDEDARVNIYIKLA